MGKFDDTVSSFTQEDGSTIMPDDVVSVLGGAHAEDLDSAVAEATAAAQANISEIIAQAVTAAVAGVKAEAFDALLETGVPAGTTPDNTDSGANGSENDDDDVTIDDLFATK